MTKYPDFNCQIKPGEFSMNTILVAEDSFTQRQLIVELLQSFNFTIRTAKNGVEALEKIELLHPDIVLLDLIMPQMNGYEVCRRMKANPKTKNIPIILCSAKGSEADRYWGLKQGADAYIAKPFQPEELIDAIKVLSTRSHV
jgi:twitching motility two-component system response regulator PilH